MRSILFRSVASTFGLLLACRCGGGGGSSPDSVLAPLVILATPELDGVVLSDGSFDTSGAILFTGDRDASENGVGSRQFFSFDLSGIPAGAEILGADVAFTQIEQAGTAYDSLGSVRFEHVDYGPSLDGSDFDTPVLADIGGLIVADPAQMLSGRGLAVTNLVIEALDSNLTRLQFRLRFQDLDSDSDGASDYAVFVDSEVSHPDALQEMRPSLTVVYR